MIGAITYREWILKYKSPSDQPLFFRVGAARNWLEDLVEDAPGMAATVVKSKEPA